MVEKKEEKAVVNEGPSMGEDLKKKVKRKQDEHLGISEDVDDKGRTIIIVDLFDKGTFDDQYNGKYVIARIEVQHSDLWAHLANQSKNAVTGDTISEMAQEIVRNRQGQNIQVKHVLEMLKHDGVDPEGRFPELTDEEQLMLNAKASSGMDLAQIYGNMPEVLNRLVIEYPDGLKLDTAKDWGHFHPGLGKELFDRCLSMLMSNFTITKGFKKK